MPQRKVEQSQPRRRRTASSSPLQQTSGCCNNIHAAKIGHLEPRQIYQTISKNKIKNHFAWPRIRPGPMAGNAAFAMLLLALAHIMTHGPAAMKPEASHSLLRCGDASMPPAGQESTPGSWATGWRQNPMTATTIKRTYSGENGREERQSMTCVVDQ